MPKPPGATEKNPVCFGKDDKDQNRQAVIQFGKHKEAKNMRVGNHWELIANTSTCLLLFTRIDEGANVKCFKRILVCSTYH